LIDALRHFVSHGKWELLYMNLLSNFWKVEWMLKHFWVDLLCLDFGYSQLRVSLKPQDRSHENRGWTRHALIGQTKNAEFCNCCYFE
jgi:hypothetical protein